MIKKIRKFMQVDFFEKKSILSSKLAFIKTKLVYSHKFYSIGIRTIIEKPLKIQGCTNIVLGANTCIHAYVWLGALPLSKQKVKEGILQIGDFVTIGHFNHIYATKKVIIHSNVLTADKVYISDNNHEFCNPFIPIKQQGVRQEPPCIIGEGTWIGENAVIIACSIGKNCVVGANTVLIKKQVPDYSIVVGNPARIVKRYDIEYKKWFKVDDLPLVSVLE